MLCNGFLLHHYFNANTQARTKAEATLALQLTALVERGRMLGQASATPAGHEALAKLLPEEGSLTLNANGQAPIRIAQEDAPLHQTPTPRHWSRRWKRTGFPLPSNSHTQLPCATGMPRLALF